MDSSRSVALGRRAPGTGGKGWLSGPPPGTPDRLGAAAGGTGKATSNVP
ncbi:hypothetical protein H8M03_12600 [Sphingomonas sabuli]|uniref:Uncharacterized protein n=1 Tax=Sphingomonas sabuli TaxID=2764186 RepID=A0A7G9L2F2_9SPHN|nr:hypothetical protein [Sphingomonas sabuli]QNM82801.1 hypothetical protein H8M03_12600 [Sphingomonas sabuli]